MTPGRIRGTRLEEVLQDFATSEEPAERRLGLFAARYPQYEADLRALADELARLDRSPPAAALSAEGERLVEQGLRCLEHAFASARAGVGAAHDIFEGKSPKELRLLAQRCSLPLTFFAKLRDRLIDPASIPRAFVAWLASASGERESDLLFSFGLPPRLSASLQFKSQEKPASQPQQSFQEAIEASSMTEEEKQRLRGFLE